jgi:DDE family transposase
VDAVIGAWLWDRAEPIATTEPFSANTTDRAEADNDTGTPRLVVLAVDGKTVRGAIEAEGNQSHLLAAMTHHHGLVIAPTEVGAKTNEIPMLPTLLDELDITGAIITADALHTQRTTARYLHGRGAEFVFSVKENQPKLFACLDRYRGRTSRSAIPRPTAVTGGSPDEPCKSSPLLTICPSRISARSSCLNVMSQTSSARRPRPSPCWESPA